MRWEGRKVSTIHWEINKSGSPRTNVSCGQGRLFMEKSLNLEAPKQMCGVGGEGQSSTHVNRGIWEGRGVPPWNTINANFLAHTEIKWILVAWEGCGRPFNATSCSHLHLSKIAGNHM